MRNYWSFAYILLATLCLLMALVAKENGHLQIADTQSEESFMKVAGFSGALLFVLLFIASEARNLSFNILELIEEMKKQK